MILLSVSLVGVPQSLRTLVIWSISEICHIRFSNVIVIIQSPIRDGVAVYEEVDFLTIISWKKSSSSHQLGHDAAH